jgi:hypothetical protein
MSLTLFPPDSGLFAPITEHPNQHSTSLSQRQLVPPSHRIAALSLNETAPERSRALTANASCPSSPSLSPATSAGTPRLGLKHKLSGGIDAYKRFKESIPDFAVFGATMSGLPIIKDAVSGIHAMQVSTFYFFFLCKTSDD